MTGIGWSEPFAGLDLRGCSFQDRPLTASSATGRPLDIGADITGSWTPICSSVGAAACARVRASTQSKPLNDTLM